MDYKNGNIHEILNDIIDDVYVGSTTQSLSKRMAKHPSMIHAINSIKYKHTIYSKIRELGKDIFTLN